MSIESNLASIAASLVIIAKYCENAPKADTPAAPVVAAPVTPMGNAQPAPTPTAPVMATPVAPAAPVPASASPSNCPITDQPSLVAYVMTSYKDMGPVKGNQIQGVLAALGIANINDATADHYPAIHAGVEALKAQ